MNICAYRKSDLQPGAGTQARNQIFRSAFPAEAKKQMGRAREIHVEIENHEDVASSCPAQKQNRLDPKIGIGRGLPRLGCASLVAVVKARQLEVWQLWRRRMARKLDSLENARALSLPESR
jgi:hypothetical protein